MATRTAPKVDSLPYVLFLIFQNQLNTDPSSVSVLVNRVQKKFPKVDLKRVPPWQVDTFTELRHLFGDLNYVLKVLENAGAITSVQANHIRSDIQEEDELIRQASAAAKLPERQLKYVNVAIPTEQLDNETKAKLERIKQARESVRLKYGHGPTFDRYMKIYDEAEKQALNRVRQDNIQLPRRPLIADPQKEKEYEELLVADKQHRARKRGQVRAVEEKAAEVRRERERREKGYIEAENVKQELKNRSRAERIPAPALQVHIKGRNVAPSAHKSVIGLAHADFIESTSGRVNHGMMRDRDQRRGAERADAYDAKRDLLESDLVTIISTELAVQGCRLNGTQRQEIAQSVADDIAEEMIRVHQDSLDVGVGLQGADTNVRRSIKSKSHDTKFRTRIASQMMQSLMDVDPSVISARDAASIVHTWLDPIIVASSQSNRLADVKTTFKPIGGKNNPGILVTRVYQINMAGQVHRAREQLIVSQHPVNWATQTIANFERARQKIRDTASSVDEGTTLKQRLDLQVAYAQGILDAKKELEKNPVGFVPNMIVNTAWGLAPDSLQKASIEARTGLIGLGGMLATIPIVGTAAAPLVAGVAINHNAQLSKTQFENKYFPILHTREWLEAYSKGKVYEFAAELFPFAKYDNRGRIIIGLNLIPATWEFMWDGIGAGLRSRYRKNLFDQLSLTGSMSLTKKSARNSFKMNFYDQLSKRWRDKDKKRGPISMLVIGPVWAIIKAGAITVLERTGYMATVRRIFNNGFTRAWKYGSGWADEAAMLREARNAFNALPAAEQTVANETMILNRFRFLIRIGKIAEFASVAWQSTKIGLGGAFRVAVVAGLASVIGAPAPLLIGAAYGVPWAATKVLQSSIFGGELSSSGIYTSGIIGRNIKPLAPLTEAWHRPLWGPFSTNAAVRAGELEISTWHRVFNNFGRWFPGTGIYIGLGMIQLGLSPGFALIPIGIDLGSKLVTELSSYAGTKAWVLKWLAGPTSVLGRVTGILGVGVNVGMLAYAIDQGGVFDIFRKFSFENLLKFSQVPMTFVGITSVAILGFGIATIPALIIGAVGTAAVFLIDRILRIPAVYDFLHNIFPHIQPGFYGTVLEQPLNDLWKFLKKQGIGVAGAGLSLIFGLFGLIRALLAGDIQGVAISVIFLALGGTIILTGISSSTYPATYYTPGTGGTATPGVETNDYIFDVEKTFVSKQGDNKITYEYRYDIDLDEEIQNISIQELDEFTNIPATDGSSIAISPENTYSSVSLNSHFGLEKTVSLSSSSPGITRQFTITLPKALSEYISGEDGFCNTLTIHIDSITMEGTEEAGDQPDVSTEICIDAEGNYVSVLTEPPVKPGTPTVVISSCFGDQRENGSTHTGLDIAASEFSEDTPIFAAGRGVIKAIGWGNSGQGRHIVINHGKGLETHYLHMKDFASGLSVGSSVSAGQYIGLMDSTGNSSGKHLHFGVLRNGEPQNPCNEKLLNLCSIYPNPYNCR